jgi:hypothetical protein
MKKYTLIGVDGNAFAITGYVSRAMKREGKSKAEINAYLDDAQSKDYYHLLSVSDDMINKLNESCQ